MHSKAYETGWTVTDALMRALNLERRSCPLPAWSYTLRPRAEQLTPARRSNLPGMPLPARGDSYPSKDEMAAYLEAYVAQFELPVRRGEGLVVGAGNSGAEIAVELARAGRRARLSGRDVGRIPFGGLSTLSA